MLIKQQGISINVSLLTSRWMGMCKQEKRFFPFFFKRTGMWGEGENYRPVMPVWLPPFRQSVLFFLLFSSFLCLWFNLRFVSIASSHGSGIKRSMTTFSFLGYTYKHTERKADAKGKDKSMQFIHFYYSTISTFRQCLNLIISAADDLVASLFPAPFPDAATLSSDGVIECKRSASPSDWDDVSNSTVRMQWHFISYMSPEKWTLNYGDCRAGCRQVNDLREHLDRKSVV